MPQDRAADAFSVRDALVQRWAMLALVAAGAVLCAALLLH
jgi:hypothetical protein